ncbi:hypothetical protein J8273_8071 [Carpediemonas membranifera]|uniref:Uncharacterized protein n=1 Tax=Carpediemonas membranifera TaxID=201153 RepID=A0A8J6AY11_9EUKA|nr:hypothetical protein J8273_8071 [Carpediemonas membranifera]|eukprot:KAG9390034.1 hypothetical protein J8273_8071 [Carpediemonas membranifera]
MTSDGSWLEECLLSLAEKTNEEMDDMITRTMTFFTAIRDGAPDMTNVPLIVPLWASLTIKEKTPLKIAAYIQDHSLPEHVAIPLVESYKQTQAIIQKTICRVDGLLYVISAFPESINAIPGAERVVFRALCSSEEDIVALAVATEPTPATAAAAILMKAPHTAMLLGLIAQADPAEIWAQDMTSCDPKGVYDLFTASPCTDGLRVILELGVPDYLIPEARAQLISALDTGLGALASTDLSVLMDGTTVEAMQSCSQATRFQLLEYCPASLLPAATVAEYVDALIAQTYPDLSMSRIRHLVEAHPLPTDTEHRLLDWAGVDPVRQADIIPVLSFEWPASELNDALSVCPAVALPEMCRKVDQARRGVPAVHFLRLIQKTPPTDQMCDLIGDVWSAIRPSRSFDVVVIRLAMCAATSIAATSWLARTDAKDLFDIITRAVQADLPAGRRDGLYTALDTVIRAHSVCPPQFAALADTCATEIVTNPSPASMRLLSTLSAMEGPRLLPVLSRAVLSLCGLPDVPVATLSSLLVDVGRCGVAAPVQALCDAALTVRLCLPVVRATVQCHHACPAVADILGDRIQEALADSDATTASTACEILCDLVATKFALPDPHLVAIGPMLLSWVQNKAPSAHSALKAVLSLSGIGARVLVACITAVALDGPHEVASLLRHGQPGVKLHTLLGALDDPLSLVVSSVTGGSDLGPVLTAASLAATVHLFPPRTGCGGHRRCVFLDKVLPADFGESATQTRTEPLDPVAWALMSPVVAALSEPSTASAAVALLTLLVGLLSRCGVPDDRKIYNEIFEIVRTLIARLCHSITAKPESRLHMLTQTPLPVNSEADADLIAAGLISHLPVLSEVGMATDPMRAAALMLVTHPCDPTRPEWAVSVSAAIAQWLLAEGYSAQTIVSAVVSGVLPQAPVECFIATASGLRSRLTPDMFNHLMEVVPEFKATNMVTGEKNADAAAKLTIHALYLLQTGPDEGYPIAGLQTAVSDASHLAYSNNSLARLLIVVCRLALQCHAAPEGWLVECVLKLYMSRRDPAAVAEAMRGFLATTSHLPSFGSLDTVLGLVPLADDVEREAFVAIHDVFCALSRD